MYSPSLATKLLVASLVPALGFVLAWGAIQQSFRSSALGEAQATRALEALALTHDVSRLADEAILEERGFLVTGDEEFATPYYAAVGRFTSRTEELELLLADDAERRAEVRDLVLVFRRWQDEVAEPAMAARRRNEVGAGAALVASTGRRLRTEIADRLTRITSAQREVVAARLRESGVARERATRWTLSLFLVTFAGSVAAAAVFVLQLRRRLTELESAAEAIARGEFERRAPTAGQDEIAHVAHSFNLMAEHVRERSRQDAGLRQLSELLQACSSLDEAFEVASSVLPVLLPSTRGVLHVINASRSQLDVAMRFGADEDPAPAPDAAAPVPPSACWAFRRGVPHRVDAKASMPECRHAGAGQGSHLCIPLLAHGENLGVLTLAPLPDDSQTGWAERLAEQVGLALANLRLRDSLRNQAIRDGLTGLYNRRYFEETAEREIARAKRAGLPLVFMMLDVDHFKRFNDTHGHDAGDYLLRQVGHLLRSSVRQSDSACRYGGEEFVLILPESRLEDAQRRAEQIRRAFHQLALSHQGKALGAVTVSIGVAVYPEHGHDWAEVVRNADAALYRAKQEGRDRVVLAPPREPGAAIEPAPRVVNGGE